MSSRARSKGLQSLVDKFIGDDLERRASLEKACDNLEIGVKLNRLRTDAGGVRADQSEVVWPSA